MSPSPHVAARAASSVLLVRDGDGSVEVLMVERPAEGFFGGLMVFPGGAVEECDRRRMDGDGTEFLVAAVRETAEEVGLLLGDGRSEPSPPMKGLRLLDEIGETRLVRAVSQLTLVSRWLTPQFAPKRFDTRFFLARVEGNPEVVLDREELVSHEWTAPQSALARSERGEWKLILPTVAHLRWLAKWGSGAEAESNARGTDGLTIIEPVALDDGTLLARYRGE